MRAIVNEIRHKKSKKNWVQLYSANFLANIVDTCILAIVFRGELYANLSDFANKSVIFTGFSFYIFYTARNSRMPLQCHYL